MSHRASRRQFLQTTAATGFGFWVAGGLEANEEKFVKSPNEKVQFACIGIGGKGSSDSADAGKHGDVVAICDVDETRLNAAGAKRFPGAKKYTDFRKLLEEMGKKVDAVTVSTPDHCHAAAAVMAMRMGKHCFCQKPLTHSIHEARVMGEVAREMKVATQMGNQGTANSGVRKAAATIQAGALGKVTEVHVWTNRPIWPQGGERPPKEAVPANLKWDLWLGPAPVRDYGKGYHPFAWRGWWDFGTGALGDMACHTVNMPFMALNLRNPLSVVAETSGHNKDSYPKWSKIVFEFAATAERPAVKLFWYDGGKRPSEEVMEGKKASGSGCMLIGTKGKLYSPNDYGAEYELLGGATQPEVQFEQSPGHFDEWVRAIKGGKPARSNFAEYAAPLTQTILLGNLAVWVSGTKVEWDAVSLNAKGMNLDHIIRPEFRKGYTL
jgi:predicted dehydrogenase